MLDRILCVKVLITLNWNVEKIVKTKTKLGYYTVQTTVELGKEKLSNMILSPFQLDKSWMNRILYLDEKR